MDHEITVTSEKSKCATSWHSDLIVVCSCGFLQRISHGSREAASDTVLFHRIQALEAEVGMKFKQTWKPGT